jgi:hypothetical protein
MPRRIKDNDAILPPSRGGHSRFGGVPFAKFDASLPYQFFHQRAWMIFSRFIGIQLAIDNAG